LDFLKRLLTHEVRRALFLDDTLYKRKNEKAKIYVCLTHVHIKTYVHVPSGDQSSVQNFLFLLFFLLFFDIVIFLKHLRGLCDIIWLILSLNNCDNFWIVIRGING